MYYKEADRFHLEHKHFLSLCTFCFIFLSNTPGYLYQYIMHSRTVDNPTPVSAGVWQDIECCGAFSLHNRDSKLAQRLMKEQYQSAFRF